MGYGVAQATSEFLIMGCPKDLHLDRQKVAQKKSEAYIAPYKRGPAKDGDETTVMDTQETSVTRGLPVDEQV
jgi:hypothetical protein